jgi:uncharacterized membrane protein YcaP (DUF421 family)
MWLADWSVVVRILLVGSAAYVSLVVLLRVSGKRTLGKLNAFDFVVTVAFGSVLATAVLDPDTAWVSAVSAMAVLVGAQFVVAQVTTWLPRGRWFVNASPTLVVRDGEVLEDQLRRVRLTHGELAQALRAQGQGSVSSVAAVVLEPDGSLSVVPESAVGDGSSLGDVDGWVAVR